MENTAITAYELKVLQFDTVMYHLHKTHITRDYSHLKGKLLKAMEIPNTISNTNLLRCIGIVYVLDNNMDQEWDAVMNKFNLTAEFGAGSIRKNALSKILNNSK